MKLGEDGGIVVERAELDVLARLAAVGLREVERRDAARVPEGHRVLYAARLHLGQVGASVVASVTDIRDAPSVRGRECSDCGREVFAALRRGRCDRCRKRLERAV